jgi:hypothetical protein
VLARPAEAALDRPLGEPGLGGDVGDGAPVVVKGLEQPDLGEGKPGQRALDQRAALGGLVGQGVIRCRELLYGAGLGAGDSRTPEVVGEERGARSPG